MCSLCLNKSEFLGVTVSRMCPVDVTTQAEVPGLSSFKSYAAGGCSEGAFGQKWTQEMSLVDPNYKRWIEKGASQQEAPAVPPGRPSAAFSLLLSSQSSSVKVTLNTESESF